MGDSIADQIEKIANGLKSSRAKENFLAFADSLKDDDVAEDDMAAYEVEIDGVAGMLASDIVELQRDKLVGLQQEMMNIFPQGKGKPVCMFGDIDLNKQGEFGWTPAHEAVIEHEIDLLTQYIAAGCDLTIRDTSGHTPYDKAARKGHLDMMEMLDSAVR